MITHTLRLAIVSFRMESLPSSPPKSAPVQSRRSYRSLPIHEPFKPKSREAECDFVLDKAWPKSSLQPRRRLPQTSSLLWRRKPHHKSSAEFFTNESRLSELKCISQHDDIFLNTHLSSSDPLLDSAVPYTLPDRSTVLVSTGLEGLLRQLVERRMVQTVLKYVPSEESGGAFSSAASLFSCCSLSISSFSLSARDRKSVV